ncbi:MAG TPA: 23S rRNA (pseudouridine(1915)-N(3))-methyltransferase RlmH [Bacteroidales bacterium]|nr:23S rRNA (pseudouridine(1915)-N(3))-methyltransferase RlmH [Bacteroidales bacterium]HRZ50123.1 23S rRNA (pseudouridine(1915)-N(3))-methyltransferase RlmH [Bacteroidales bacterium]
MRIDLIVPGSTGERWIRDGVSAYIGRIQHYAPFRVRELPAVKNAASLTPLQLQQEEYLQLKKLTKEFDRLVLLDESGTQFRSVEFADFLQKQMNAGTRALCFFAGGPYGFAPELRAAGYPMMSLSKMTFTHQMVRLVFTEQLYRAFTILKGEGYHHE